MLCPCWKTWVVRCSIICDTSHYFVLRHVQQVQLQQHRLLHHRPHRQIEEKKEDFSSCCFHWSSFYAPVYFHIFVRFCFFQFLTFAMLHHIYVLLSMCMGSTSSAQKVHNCCPSLFTSHDFFQNTFWGQFFWSSFQFWLFCCCVVALSSFHLVSMFWKRHGANNLQKFAL